jgi:Flp pilus assembly CpaE family ATPase
VGGDPHLLKEFASYILVSRAPSLIIDAGNRFDPFMVSFFCRKLEREVMEQIFVSRAFTVFQLKALITRELPAFMQTYSPSVVVVSQYSDLFQSDDVDEEILTILHKKLLLRLKEIVKEYDVPIMVIDRKNTARVFDCRILMRTQKTTILLSVDQHTLQVPLIPPDQKTLDCWRKSHG